MLVFTLCILLALCIAVIIALFYMYGKCVMELGDANGHISMMQHEIWLLMSKVMVSRHNDEIRVAMPIAGAKIDVYEMMDSRLTLMRVLKDEMDNDRLPDLTGLMDLWALRLEQDIRERDDGPS